ncbi:hypothetical protein BJX76DRAFT_356733 [Aspergillus varians]
MNNGKAARLRASCDACNEAKVRCSKAKPSCARCEKQNLTCMYGLSRRSHRDAPRIGALQETAAPSMTVDPSSTASGLTLSSHHPSPPPPQSSGTRTGTGTCGGGGDAVDMSTSPTPAPGGLSDLIVGHQPDGHHFSTPGIPMREFPPFCSDTAGILDMYIDQFHDPVDGTMDLDSALQSIEELFPVGLSDSPSRWPCLPNTDLVEEPFSTSTDTSRPWNPLAGDNPGGVEGAAAESVLQDTSTELPCSCSSRILKQLASMPLSAWDEESIASFDMQLSQLRRAVKISEACIGCSCIARDEMTILLISILVGRALQGFEATLSKLRPSSPQSTNNNSDDLPTGQQQQHDIQNATNTTTAAPKLSWGVLQIEPDEEEELKQHLWLLQFRKLGRVLNVFSSSLNHLRRPGNSSGSDLSTHVTACRCIHMWLVQKAHVISSRYEREHDTVRTPRPASSMDALL